MIIEQQGTTCLTKIAALCLAALVGVGVVSCSDATSTDSSERSGSELATPPDATAPAAPPDATAPAAPPDATTETASPDATAETASPDATAEAASPDATGEAAPAATDDLARVTLQAETTEGWQFELAVAIPENRFDGLLTASTDRGFLEFEVDPVVARGFESEFENAGGHIVLRDTLLVWPVGPEQTSVDDLNAAQRTLVPLMIDGDEDFRCGRGGIWIPLLVDFEPFPLIGNRPLLACKVHPVSVYEAAGDVDMSNSYGGEDAAQMDVLAAIVNVETPYCVARIVSPASELIAGCYLVVDLADLAAGSAAIDCTPTIIGP